jgi:cytochrome c oxidase subunit 3
MLGLAMGSSVILFFFLLGVLMARKWTTGLDPLPLPSLFYASTVLLLISSGTLVSGHRSFVKESFQGHRKWLVATFLLGVGFVLLQIGGWWQLFAGGHFLNSGDGAAYVYLLTGLHLLHMFIALAMLGWCLSDSLGSKTYIDGYLLGLNPAKRTRMRIAQWLWHFADLLWLALFLVLSLVLEY